MTLLRPLALLALLPALVACGSSGGGGDPGAPAPTPSTSFATLAVQGEALMDEHANDNATPDWDVPTTGEATFRGVGAWGPASNIDLDPADADAFSKVDLTADFSADTIEGRAYDFRAAPSIGHAITGEILFTGGTITGNDFQAEPSGTLVGGGVPVTYGSGDLRGTFAGPDAEALVATGIMVRTPQGETPDGTYVIIVADR